MMPLAWHGLTSFHMLISAHRDGRIIAGAMTYFGIETIAGSTSRGGSSALREILKRLKEGGCVGITPGWPARPGDDREHRDRQYRPARRRADRAGDLRHEPPARARDLGPLSPRPAVRTRRVFVRRARSRSPRNSTRKASKTSGASSRRGWSKWPARPIASSVMKTPAAVDRRRHQPAGWAGCGRLMLPLLYRKRPGRWRHWRSSTWSDAANGARKTPAGFASAREFPAPSRPQARSCGSMPRASARRPPCWR